MYVVNFMVDIMETHQLVIGALGLILGPAGAAWIGVRVAMNGMRQSLQRVELKVDNINGRVTANAVDIARLDEHCRGGQVQ